MSKIQFLSNQPILPLSPANDLFNTVEKGKAIASFLSHLGRDSKENIRMFALYGKWGSGKTTLMRFLQSHLDPTRFQTLYFEAWKHEKDGNLALSLADALNHESAQAADSPFMESASRFLSQDPLSGQKNGSYFEQRQDFEDRLRELEQKLAPASEDGQSPQIVVLIDDLDRCQPAQILRFLSTLKLFFSSGGRMLFFCGVDKEAVSAAVQHSYQDVIRPEEYLEKIFDFTFAVPTHMDTRSLLQQEFKGHTEIRGKNRSNSGIISDFLDEMDFTVPRHLKKILNKYKSLRIFKEDPDMDKKLKKLIPNVLTDRQGNVVETLFTLFFILLHEYYPEKLAEIENREEKKKAYTQLLMEAMSAYAGEDRFKEDILEKIDRLFGGEGFEKRTLRELRDEYFERYGDFKDYHHKALINLHSPARINSFDNFRDYDDYLDQFTSPGNDILVSFCKFMFSRESLFFDSEDLSDYPFSNFFRMTRTLL